MEDGEEGRGWISMVCVGTKVREAVKGALEVSEDERPAASC